MIEFKNLTPEDQIAEVSNLAETISREYFSEVKSITLVNFEFNATFEITSKFQRCAMRININSQRTAENIKAEIEFVKALGTNKALNLPRPVPTLNGEFVVSASLPSLSREVHVVMYSWLEGSEVGDEPTQEQVYALGAAMAHMHNTMSESQLTVGSALPTFDDFLWGTNDYLFSGLSEVGKSEKLLLLEVRSRIEEIVAHLFEKERSIPIHADLHGWNVMWHEDAIAIFDFDDSGIGLPLQDLATAIYYLDTPDQEKALLSGYQSIRPLPKYSHIEMRGLLLQRRILLLNYLYETMNQEHSELLTEYLPETIRRAELFLNEIVKS